MNRRTLNLIAAVCFLIAGVAFLLTGPVWLGILFLVLLALSVYQVATAR